MLARQDKVEGRQDKAEKVAILRKDLEVIKKDVVMIRQLGKVTNMIIETLIEAGFIFDSTLSFSKQISSLSSAYHYHIRDLRASDTFSISLPLPQ